MTQLLCVSVCLLHHRTQLLIELDLQAVAEQNVTFLMNTVGKINK